MTTETELVTTKIRERIGKSGLLHKGEQVTAYVNGFTLPPIASPLKFALRAILSPYRPSSWRAVVLTDQELYICSLKGGRPGKLKSVLAHHPRGSYTASIADSGRPTTTLEVAGVSVSCPSKGRMRRSADMIVAAGKPAEELPA